MRTKEVETKTGLTKQTILYYEKEKLINPLRDDNGYRHYSDEDVQLLLLIKLLRNMKVSLDDIRLVLHKELSFQDVLENQSRYLENTIQEIQKVKQDIDFYKEKKVPLIPVLQEIEKVDEKSILGFQKTTPQVSIGRRLTKRFLMKKILLQIVNSFIIGGACYFGAQHFYKIENIWILIGVTVTFFMIQVMAYGLGWGEMGSVTIGNNATLFVEFDEEGMSYANVNSFGKRINYAKDILLNKDRLRHVNYEDITKVEMHHLTRYMKIPGSNLPTHIEVIDYYFTFKDQSQYTLINPMLLENDQEMINMILKEKVKNVIEVTK